MTAPKPRPARVLLVAADGDHRQALAKVLSEGGWTLDVVATDDEALATVAQAAPDVVVYAQAPNGARDFGLYRLLRADTRHSALPMLALAYNATTEERLAGLALGVDDVLPLPVAAGEVLAKVRAMLRVRGLVAQLRADKVELAQLHDELRKSFNQLIALLVHLIDMGAPGAADRGRRLAEKTGRLAERFEIPGELHRDLELAALLYEIGRVIDPERRGQDSTKERDWRVALLARAALEQVEQFQGVAEVLAGVYENWDGSGRPDRKQRGQIPLRSRILRVVNDFCQLLDRPGATGRAADVPAALAELESRAGTWYDPAVVAQLEALCLETPALGRQRARRKVGIDELVPGMVLAEDLCTNAGMKLMARGTTISLSSLQIVLDRHHSDPIISGAWILEAPVP